MLDRKSDPRQTGSAPGAYGLRIDGLQQPDRHLVDGGADWPLLRIDHAAPDGTEPHPPGTVLASKSEAEIWIADGQRIDVMRDPMVVRFRTRERPPDELVLHPYLGLPAALLAHWHGRHALHGGAFLFGRGAWAVIGDRAGGKSSTLAAVMQRGGRIVSDDILVLDGTTVFAGPRAVDLRAGEAVDELGGELVGDVGGRARWRLRPEPVPGAVKLSGLIHLEWGDEVAVEPLWAEDRLNGVIANSVVRPGEAVRFGLLDLAALPAWSFIRPPSIAGLWPAVDQLLELLA